MVKRDTIEMLIMGGAFDSLHPNRRALLWAMDELVALRSSAVGLVEADLTAYETVVEKYERGAGYRVSGIGCGVRGTGHGVRDRGNPDSGIGNRHPELVEGCESEAGHRKPVILRQAQDDGDDAPGVPAVAQTGVDAGVTGASARTPGASEGASEVKFRVQNLRSQIPDPDSPFPSPDSPLHDGRRLKPAATGSSDTRNPIPETPPPPPFPISVLRQAQDDGFRLPTPETRYPIPHTPNPIRDFSAIDKFWLEYRVLGLTPSCHVMSYIREEMAKRKVLSTKEFREQKNGARVWVGGLSIRPHRPPTRSGTRVLFVTLEDEFGMAPVTFFEKSYKEWGHVLFAEPLVAIHGRIQRQVRGVTLIADKAVTIPWKALCPDEDDNTEARRGEAMKRRANTWLSPFPQR